MTAQLPIGDDYAGDYAHATAEPLGRDVSGRISNYDDQDAFKVQVVEGKSYVVTYTPAPDTSSSQNIFIDQPDALTRSGRSENGAAVMVPFVATSTGFAIIAISGYYGSTNYTWRVDEVTDDFSSSVNTSGRLTLGQAATGRFETAADRDWFAIDVEANVSYTFRLGTGHDDAFLQIYDVSGHGVSDGRWVPQHDGAALLWTPFASGHYFISASSDASGAYSLAMQKTAPDDYGQTPSTAARLAAGTALTGHFERPGDADWYRIAVKPGQDYLLHIEPGADMPASEYLDFTLYDEQQKPVTPSGAMAAARGMDLVLQPSTDQVLYAQLRHFGALGSYTVSLSAPVADAIPAAASSTVQLRAGGVIRSTIDFDGDRDWVRIDLVAGERYSFSMQGATSHHGTLGQPMMNLLDASGKALAWGSSWGDGRDADIWYNASKTETAWLSLQATQASTGSYTVRMADSTTPYADIDPPTAFTPTLPTRGHVIGTPLSRDIHLDYNEAVKLSGEVKVLDSRGGVVQVFHPGDAGVTVSSHSVILHLAAALADGSSYVVSGMAGAIIDLAGNAAAGFSHQFVTPETSLQQTGGAGNDVFHSGTGSDEFTGGAGFDQVIFAGKWSSYSVYKSPGRDTASVLQYFGSNASDELTGIERAIFDDKGVAFDVDGTAGQTFRLYQAAFDRQPDLPGLGYWITQRDHGLSLIAMAEYFMSSTEFVKLYGSGPSNLQWATALYHNVMHREPDAPGLAFWVDKLDHGAAAAEVLVQFSESPENQANVIGRVLPGIVYDLYFG